MTWDRVERRKQTMSCQQEIIERLTRIEANQENVMQQIVQTHQTIHGNGKPGLLIEHDRNKQIILVACWSLGTLWVAFLGALVKAWVR